MEFNRYYLVFLKKGPSWTAESTPELERLQKRHQAHLAGLRAGGYLAMAGPVEASEQSDLRGISVFPYNSVDSLGQLKDLVEADPAFQAGRLVGEYLLWYVPRGDRLGGGQRSQ